MSALARIWEVESPAFAVATKPAAIAAGAIVLAIDPSILGPSIKTAYRRTAKFTVKLLQDVKKSQRDYPLGDPKGFPLAAAACNYVTHPQEEEAVMQGFWVIGLIILLAGGQPQIQVLEFKDKATCH